MLIKNKKEIIGQNFLCADITADDLESSGLSPAEKYHLCKWTEGLESGRHCMLALLDSRLKERNLSNDTKLPTLTSGSSQRSMELTMLSSTISLPDDFLCDSGYLYDKVFSKPPGAVVKEALELLADKAMEKNSSTLRIDQINLALKQLRVQNLSSVKSSTSTASNKKSTANAAESTETETCTEGNNDGQEDVGSPSSLKENRSSQKGREANSGSSAGDEHVSPAHKELESFRLQIMIELIRMHILAQSHSAAKPPAASTPKEPINEGNKNSGAVNEIRRSDLPPPIPTLNTAGIPIF
jgi:hypothetical protein